MRIRLLIRCFPYTYLPFSAEKNIFVGPINDSSLSATEFEVPGPRYRNDVRELTIIN